jgi:toxin-antitoxin system PIN domain toxin
MRCVDVNVLVYGFRADTGPHHLWRPWLDAARRDAEPLGLLTTVATGFVRVVTHPKVFAQPTPVDEALAFLDALRASPSVVPVDPGPRFWPLFDQVCRRHGARGNRVPDAAIAASVLEQRATLVTTDRGFARYAGVRLQFDPN